MAVLILDHAERAVGWKKVSSGDEDNVFLQSSVAHLFKQFREAIAHFRIYQKKNKTF